MHLLKHQLVLRQCPSLITEEVLDLAELLEHAEILDLHPIGAFLIIQCCIGLHEDGVREFAHFDDD